MGGRGGSSGQASIGDTDRATKYETGRTLSKRLGAVKAGDEELKELFANSNLTEKEKAALERYVEPNSQYRKLNRALRAGKDYDKDWQRDLDSAIKKSPKLKKSIIVYRGTGISSNETYNALKKGATFRDLEHTSTSIGRKIATGFQEDYKNNVLFKIRVPRGSRAAYVDALSRGFENEILFGAGSKFKITSTRKVKGYKVVNATFQGYTKGKK